MIVVRQVWLSDTLNEVYFARSREAAAQEVFKSSACYPRLKGFDERFMLRAVLSLNFTQTYSNSVFFFKCFVLNFFLSRCNNSSCLYSSFASSNHLVSK